MKHTLFLFILCPFLIASCGSNTSKTPVPPVSGSDVPFQADAVRAVWIPDPSHTKAITTYENVLKTVQLFADLKINTIYLCAFAGPRTAFKSEVLKDYSTYTSIDEGYMFASYMDAYSKTGEGGGASPTNDPVKDLIAEAHKKGIKVIFWFEYGFMGSHGPTPDTHPLLAKNPHWKSLGNDKLQSNYNGTDYYMNAYHPDLQEFLLKLIDESFNLYPDLDGVQGDDRMPAMPRNSGYDVFTTNLYKKAHKGKTPPADFEDPQWVRWRLDLLNDFGKAMHARVKAKNPNALVCFSPNPYPWCEEKLMQDWPQWIADGIVDMLSVQCYRYNIEAYTATVQSAMDIVKSKTDKSILNPGMVLKAGDKITDKDLLIAQLKANRAIGTNGEAFFYNEGLLDSTAQAVIKAAYVK